MRIRKILGASLIALLWVLLFSDIGGAAPLMVEKNLFAQDRKPPSREDQTVSANPNKPSMSAKAIQLDGVIIYGDTKKAVLRFKGQIPGMDDKHKASSPYITVKEGDKVGDFVVTRIEPKSIVLERDGEASELRLFAEGKVSPPPPPAPAMEAPQPQPGVIPTPGQPGAPNQGAPPHGFPAVQRPAPVPPQAINPADGEGEQNDAGQADDGPEEAPMDVGQ